MSEKCDVLIIGAGILGCFAARALSRYNLDILVLEKREDICTGISRANTGIIYQGYDQHPGSLKAQLCRKASLGFPALCKELDVRYRKTGLLMLSYGPNADAVLRRKIEHGALNGINDIRMLDTDEVYKYEPLLSEGIRHALCSENTYTVNPWELGIAAFENARANGVNFRFEQEVMSIRREGGGFILETQDNTYIAERVLCCAGFSADSVWELVNKPIIRIVPQGADYLVFDKNAGGLINHVISVEPEEKGEGLTLVPTADGNILAGPTRRNINGAPDYSTASSGLNELVSKCAQLIPALKPEMIIRNFGAARPNPFYLNEDGTASLRSITDFAILEEDGFFDLIGVKTPGVTCANELGVYISERIIESFESRPSENRSFSPYRKGIIKISELIDRSRMPLCTLPDISDKTSLADLPDLSGKHVLSGGHDQSGLPALSGLPAEYSQIICRCEHISKGEILEAIRRGATTIDGVKRRIGTCMGRCQGGYCMQQIMHILSEELGRDIYSITKDGTGSEILDHIPDK